MDFVYKPQVRIDAPESIQGPMQHLSMSKDGPGRSAANTIRDKRGSDASQNTSRPTPYDRDRRQGNSYSWVNNCKTLFVTLEANIHIICNTFKPKIIFYRL